MVYYYYSGLLLELEPILLLNESDAVMRDARFTYLL